MKNAMYSQVKEISTRLENEFITYDEKKRLRVIINYVSHLKLV